MPPNRSMCEHGSCTTVGDELRRGSPHYARLTDVATVAIATATGPIEHRCRPHARDLLCPSNDDE